MFISYQSLILVLLGFLMLCGQSSATTVVIDARDASNAEEAEDMYQQAVIEAAEQGGVPVYIKLLIFGDVGFDPGVIEIPYGISHIRTDVYIHGPVTRQVTIRLNDLRTSNRYYLNLYSEINIR